MFAWGCLELVRILVLTSTRWMRCSEQDTVEKACELEHETKKKQEMIEEPNKNEKTCRFGHDIPEGSVGPRIIGKGFRQPTRPCGWDRRWVGFLVCCLAFAPASAAAIPHLEETQKLNDICHLVALNRSPQGSFLLASSAAAMAAADTAKLEGRLGGFIGISAGKASRLQNDTDG